MKITVKMFGAFRVLGDQVELEVDEAATVFHVREKMAKILPSEDLTELLALSKFANQREILADHGVCDPHQELAVLPPVSGG